ncbi:hypothetical protein RJ639_004445, partial [Escallonia herrerae]
MLPNDFSVETQASERNLSYYRPLYKAVVRGDWKTVERFFDQDKHALTARISILSQTAVQIAVATGKAIHFVEKLVHMIPPEALLLQSMSGNTALSYAARVGNTKAATALVEKNPSSLYIRTRDMRLPLHLAAEYAHKDTLLYLLRVTKEDVGPTPPFDGQSGVELLVHVITSGYFGAPIISENCSNNKNGVDIEDPAGTSQGIMQMLDRIRLPQGSYFTPGLAFLQQFRITLWEGVGLLVPPINFIRDKKLVHNQALQLVKCLCNEMEFLSDHTELMLRVTRAVVIAARLNVHEVVEEIVDAFPQAALSCEVGTNYSIFQLAIINRCEKVFNLIYQMGEQKHFLNMLIDNSGNNILHLAGRLAPLHKRNLISGAALQMQRELQWFKEVEKFVKPAFKEMQNSDKDTPAMVFTREHMQLVIEGEKWMKETATSCSIAAALIVTIVFAAAITVPGGNNQDIGYPIFSRYQAFIIFAFSDAISLFTSVTSLLMFLSILTTRYAEEEFLYALPKRLIIGFLTLFLAITSMILAFGATVYLVFGQAETWVLGPVAAFACLP